MWQSDSKLFDNSYVGRLIISVAHRCANLGHEFNVLFGEKVVGGKITEALI